MAFVISQQNATMELWDIFLVSHFLFDAIAINVILTKDSQKRPISHKILHNCITYLTRLFYKKVNNFEIFGKHAKVYNVEVKNNTLKHSTALCN